MAGEYYRVGVQIAMSSNASAVLGALGRELMGVHVKAKDLEGGLNRIKVAAIGLGGVMAGSAVLSGMAKLVEHGKDFVHQQSLMAQAGVSQADIANATGAAWKNASNILNAGATDNLKLLADLRNEFGRMDEAVKASGAFTKLGVVTANVTGANPEEAGYQASRFLDLRGSLVDPKTGQISEQRAEAQAKLLEAITVVTRGRVGSGELLNFQKQARGAGANLTDTGLENMVPVIQAMGGYRTGTSLMSMMQEVIGGRLTQQAGKFLEEAGVLDPHKVSVRRGGQIVVGAGGVRDEQLLATDPVKYIDTVIRSGLTRMGASTPEAQTVLLMRDGLRQTVNGLITEVIRNAVPFARDAGNIRQGAVVDQYEVMAKTDPSLKMQAFTTAWNNLLTSLGAPIVGDATGQIAKLTGAINGLAQWTSAHPRVVSQIEEAVASLGGLAVVGGSLAITGAALGPFVTGMKVLSGVLGGVELAAGVAALAPLGVGLLAVAGGVAALAGAVAIWPKIHEMLQAHGVESVPLPNARPTSPPTAYDFAHPFAPPQIQKQSYEAPSGGDGHMLQPINFVLDGKVVATHVARINLRAQRPNVMTGTTAPDYLQTPLPAGMSPMAI